MRLIRTCALTLGTILLLVATDASAQTCLGSPSYAEGPFQASVVAALTDGAQGFGGGFAVGSEDYFGGVNVGYTNASDLDSTATSFGMIGGASVALSDRDRIFACPVASLGYTSGPDIGAVDVSLVSFRAGGRMGLVAAQSGSIAVVPTFGLDLAYDRVTTQFAGVDVSGDDTYAIARAGLGIVYNRTIAFVSTLGVPLGLDGSDPEFTFAVTFNLGSR